MSTYSLKRRSVLAAFGLVGATSLVGCGDYPDPDSTPPSIAPSGLQKVPLESAWAFVDSARGTVFFVDGHGGVPHARQLEIGTAPAKFEKRNGQDEVLVLTQGVVGTRGVEEESAMLWVIPANPAVPLKTVKLDARFTSFSQSPDGNTVVLFFGGKSKVSGDVAFNPNQLAVVDLSVPVPVAVPRTVPSLGSVPTAIDFSPTLNLAEKRSLLLVRSKNYVTLIDLKRTEGPEGLKRPDVSIPLTLPDDPRELNPVQVVWDPIGPGVFIRVDSGSDIFSIRFAPLDPAVDGKVTSDFRAVLSQLAAGRTPSDMVLYDAGKGLRLLVAGADKNVLVVDPVSSRTIQIPIEHDVRWISTWKPIVAVGMPEPSQQALLVSSSSAKVTFVDLQELESLKTRNLEVVNLPAPAENFRPSTAQGLSVVQHADRSITVIGLGARTVSPIRSTIGIQSISSSPALPTTLFLMTPNDRLGMMSLVPGGALAVTDVRLDDKVSDLMVTSGTLEPDLKPKLIVVHPDSGGYVTVLDATAPKRDVAKSLRGFVSTNLLSRTKRNVP
jgi:hypothetical protein